MAEKRVAKWEIFEERFASSGRCDNPFTDVSLTVVFEGPGRRLWIDGFYDGEEEGGRGGLWRVRFAPPVEGRWSYSTVSSDSGLDGKSGAFVCTAPVSRGPLTVDPQFPNWFFRADGRPFFVVNDGWAPHPGFGNKSEHGDLRFGYPSEADVRTYLDVLGRYGVNLLIEVNQLFARQPSNTDPSFKWPWQTVDPQKNRIDRDRFNLEYYQRLDRTVAYAKDRGIFYGLELLFDNSVWRQLEWSHHPVNAANGGWLEDSDRDGTGFQEMFDLGNRAHVEYIGRYVAYTVARLSAYWNLYWALGAECGNIDRPGADRHAAWYGHWGDYVAARDPHGRLQAIGDTGECEALVRHSRNNIMITQEHTPMDDLALFCANLNRFGERFWGYDRPVIIGEQDRFNNNCYDRERRGFWVSFVSGFAMGRVDRHYPLADGQRLYESKLFGLSADPPIYADLDRMARLVEQSGLAWWRMEPSDGLLVEPSSLVYCLAEAGREYLVYFAEGGSAGLQLPGGSFEASWLNPRTGEIAGRQRVAGGGLHRFTAADGEDWGLHVVHERLR